MAKNQDKKLDKKLSKKSVCIISAIAVILLVALGSFVGVNIANNKKKAAEQNAQAAKMESTTAKATTVTATTATNVTTNTTTNATTNTKVSNANKGEAATKGKKYESNLTYLYKINRQQNLVIVYTKDASGEYTVPIKAMTCSVGKEGRTRRGVFKTVGSRYRWLSLYGGVYGQYATRIQGHYLFHSVPYYSQNKADLETEEYNKLGSPASLGCIRLSVADAKWVYEHCPKGTIVDIYDSSAAEPMAKPTPKRIPLNSPYRGWDPTDPDPSNPWLSVTTQPQTTVPPTTVPKTTNAQTTKPQATKPETTQAQTTKPQTTKPQTTKPETTQAQTTEAKTTKASTTNS